MGHSTEQSAILIRLYYSELAEHDKCLTSNQFVKFGSVHRVIIATDAMRMGINNSDVLLVIQWKQPNSMCSLTQWAGKAAREEGIWRIHLISRAVLWSKARRLASNADLRTRPSSQLSRYWTTDEVGPE